MQKLLRDRTPRFLKTESSAQLMQNKAASLTALSVFRVKYKQSISRVLYRSRGDNHLSRACVAARLKRRYPEGRRAASTLPYLVLLRVGFAKPDGHPPAGALLPHLSTLA